MLKSLGYLLACLQFGSLAYLLVTLIVQGFLLGFAD